MALAAKGIEIAQADLDDRQSLADVLDGAYACFIVTDTQFKRTDCGEYEYSQGENVADICMVKKVRHVVFCSQLNAFDGMGLQVKHYDAKSRIEDFMKERALPLTTIMISCYYGHFLTWLKPQKYGDHMYKIAIPMGNISLDVISVAQIGEAVRSILNNRAQTLNRNFLLSGDKLTIVEIARTFSKHLRPYEFIDAQFSPP
ncbi:nmrA-like family domain-containing protein 1 [Anneissia japonica]|uniref:nmrA-like family domain-containing protein 1 n=1 Tax=Anneissia japonica TaxID=1529436 RepID=UPI00142571EE|nr:nmrA-like family domain-containing protein 1 [Anneissia japonica]